MPDAGELLDAMLRAHPDAWVGAIGPDALYVPLPASVPASTHRRLQGRWALDQVAVGHRAPLSETWRRRREDGHASLRVQLVGGGAATFHVFDTAALHGVDVVVAMVEGDADLGSPPVVADILTSSRFARVLRDDTGRTIEIDDAAPDVLGWSADVLLSRSPPLERVHVEDHHQVIESWMSTLAEPSTGHRTRVRLVRSDGSHRWFEMTNFNRLDDPTRPHVVTEFLDISEEMSAHEAVRAREQMLHRLAEALPLGVLQVDLERKVVYKNDLLATIIGAGAAATVAEQFASTVAEDLPLVTRAFDAALLDAADDDVVLRMTPGGARSERLIRLITKALRAESGEATGVIACISDVTETELMGRELERRATFDALTGCLNRATVLARLDSLLSTGDDGCAVIYVDLDEFKTVNDRGGHAVGDEMLKAAARVLDGATRDADAVGRLGGDEFLVVCADVASASEAMELANRISAGLRRHPSVIGSPVPLRASIGVAWARAGAVSSDGLVERADAAMYMSKRSEAGEPELFVDDRGDERSLSA